MKLARLGEVAEIVRDGIAPEKIVAGTPYLGLEHIESGGRIISSEPVANGELASTKFQFGPEHLLYGKLRPYLAKIALPDFAGICSTDILPVKAGPDLDKRYLAYFLRQPKMVDFANSRSSGANLPRLSPKALADIQIPLPPLPEQRRIAGILDQADTLRRLRRQSLSRLSDLGQAIFYQMFGDLRTNSKNWDTAKLGDLCDLVRGSSPRPQGDPRYFGGPVPRLMIADITRDGKRVTPRIDSLTVEGAKLSRPMTAGSVVMAVSGAVGLPAILAENACIHDGFVGFRNLDDSLLPDFLYHYLVVQRIENSSKGTGAIWKNLTTDHVRDFIVPRPTKTEQRKFLDAIEAVEARESLLGTHSEKIVSLFAALQHRAFRGEL